MIHPKAKYSLDFVNNGSIDMKGVYKLNGDTMIVYDTEGENICDPEAKGIYKWKVEKTKLTMITVSDECENRGAPIGEPMVFTRM